MLIAYNGPPRAGKTTLAKKVELLGWPILALNKPFVDFVQQSLGVTPERAAELKDRTGGDFKAPLRDAYIAAADAIELVDPDIWVKVALRNRVEGGAYQLDALGKQTQLDWIAREMEDEKVLVVRMFRSAEALAKAAARDVPAEFNQFGNHKFDDGRECMVRRPWWDKVRFFNVLNDGPVDDLDHYADMIVKKVQAL